MAWRGLARYGSAGLGSVWQGSARKRQKGTEVSRNNGAATAIGPDVTNGAAESIEYSEPYIVDVTIEGTVDILYHRWNCEAVAAQAASAKGSKAKKTDNIESYVYRNDAGELCLPGEYLRQSIIHAAKFRQDPRSPRKSAMDLYKAGVIALTPLASHGIKTWDYEHRCRVTIQRNGITRVRPAIKQGWTATVQIMVNTPEYIRPNDLHDVLNAAGRLVGLADFRPSYGRFLVKSFDVGLS
jgi:archaeosine-15-forming tRNA-guanine transglycosylase